MQTVWDVHPKKYGKRADKKPVTCDYGDIFKGCMLKPKLYRERGSQENYAGSRGKTLWAGYVRPDSVGINPFHPTSHKDWQPSSVVCKLMECMVTDRLGRIQGSYVFFVDYQSKFRRGRSLMGTKHFFSNLQFLFKPSLFCNKETVSKLIHVHFKLRWQSHELPAQP